MNPATMRAACAAALGAALLALASAAASAPAAADARGVWPDDGGLAADASLPAGMRVLRDVAYGSDARQRFDVYLPARAADHAPVIFMVHGGAWRAGDKRARGVVENKLRHWAARGYVFVSANYRLVPQADPLEQARDVARALAAAQDRAASWGADRAKFVLMGHSAGAHLVALLATSPALSAGIVTVPWLGTVSLDSGEIDLVQTMEHRHFSFYDWAFGADPAYWIQASPFHALARGARPVLLVCSTRRTYPCPQARRFADKAAALGVAAAVLPEDYSHAEINARLGADAAYTATVDAFIGGLLR